MIRTVHLLKLAENMDTIENQVEQMPFDMIPKYIKFQMGCNLMLHSFLNMINAFRNYIKLYSINLIFGMVYVLGEL